MKFYNSNGIKIKLNLLVFQIYFGILLGYVGGQWTFKLGESRSQAISFNANQNDVASALG